jgi:hypothetical protein
LPAASAKPQPEPPHSVLPIGLIDREGEPTHEAVNRVLSFLAERLRLDHAPFRDWLQITCARRATRGGAASLRSGWSRNCLDGAIPASGTKTIVA